MWNTWTVWTTTNLKLLFQDWAHQRCNTASLCLLCFPPQILLLKSFTVCSSLSLVAAGCTVYPHSFVSCWGSEGILSNWDINSSAGYYFSSLSFPVVLLRISMLNTSSWNGQRRLFFSPSFTSLFVLNVCKTSGEQRNAQRTLTRQKEDQCNHLTKCYRMS